MLLSSLLNEDDDYINLTVVRLFTQLASKHPRSTTKEILDHYVDANEVEEHRAQALEALPEQLMKAIPTLRFISVGAGDVNEDNLAGRPLDSPDNLWSRMFLDEKMEKRHWRINGEGDARILHEMSEQDVVRLRANVTAAQVEELLRM